MEEHLSKLKEGVAKCYTQIGTSRSRASVLRKRGFNENLPAVYQVHSLEPYIQVHMDKITHTWDDLAGRLELDFRHYFSRVVDLDAAAPASSLRSEIEAERLGLPQLADVLSGEVEQRKKEVRQRHPDLRPGGSNPPFGADGSDPTARRAGRVAYHRI